MASKMDRWKAISAAGGKGAKDSAPNKNKAEIIESLSRVATTGGAGSEPENPTNTPVAKTQEQEPSKDATIIIEETRSEDKGGEGKKEPSSSVESSSKDSTQDSGVQNKSTESEYTLGVESKSNTPTDNDKDNPSSEPEPPDHEEVPVIRQGNSFANKVSQNIRDTIDNKVTKEKTHKKTSVLLKLDTLDKLANYDMAMGGRIQGLFINDLLDNFFEELEQDPKWEKILNKKVIRRR